MQIADSTRLFISRCRCRYIVLTVFLVVLITLYTIMNLRNYGLYTGNHPFFAAQPCEYLDSEQKDQLLNMAYSVHKILDDLGIEHWLMYGSVFGAIRAKGPLPWDNDVDIGFNGSGTFASIDFNEFLSAFESKGLKVYHKRWLTSNVMKVYGEDLPYINVDLFALYNYGGTMKRAGLETWIFAPNYNLYHTFPAKLVEKPLPQVPFGSYKMPVPREGIEIQKYLYPNNWFKEVKPVTSSGRTTEFQCAILIAFDEGKRFLMRSKSRFFAYLSMDYPASRASMTFLDQSDLILGRSKRLCSQGIYGRTLCNLSRPMREDYEKGFPCGRNR